MATVEVAQARERLETAQRCVGDSQREARDRRMDLDRALAKLQNCRFDETRAQGELERALNRQQNVEVQLQQVERALAPGALQSRLGGDRSELEATRRRHRSTLNAAPG